MASDDKELKKDLEKIKIQKMLTCVVQGQPDELAVLVKANPNLLFESGEVTDYAGQTYKDVSAYLLMKIVGDEDMRSTIIPLIPKELKEKLNEQDAKFYQNYLNTDEEDLDSDQSHNRGPG